MAYNCPDNVSASDETAPWMQIREPVQDEGTIGEALEDVDNLIGGLIYLDRHIFPSTHFGEVYGPLQRLALALREMLGEED